MKKDLSITINQPFEEEWEIDYDIFAEDKIDATIPFLIFNQNGEVALELVFNYGLAIIKFDNEDNSKLVLSLYETDMLDVGKYTYSYNAKTLSGREICDLSGNLNVLDETAALPSIKREVRPWDLLRSKAPGGAGERASDEEQEKRMSICEACPRFVKLTTQCLECGCVMKLKTKLAQATCPLGKW